MADLDLRNPRKPKRSEKLSLSEADHYSETWAKIAKPFAVAIFGLVAIVIIVPFVIVVIATWHGGAGCGDQLERVLDWAKTVLAPIVGFGSAVVGYYFGTRSTTTAKSRITETSGPAEDEGE